MLKKDTTGLPKVWN